MQNYHPFLSLLGLLLTQQKARLWSGAVRYNEETVSFVDNFVIIIYNHFNTMHIPFIIHYLSGFILTELFGDERPVHLLSSLQGTGTFTTFTTSGNRH